jgi:hypothetical protein
MQNILLETGLWPPRPTVGTTYQSCDERARHVQSPEDEEGDADVELRCSGGVLHVRLKHRFDHAVAAEADEVVNERHEDGWVLCRRKQTLLTFSKLMKKDILIFVF